MTRRGERGTTLIELMIALAIGTILSLAVFSIMATFEGRRRTVNSGSDLDQAGSVAMFQIDRWVRNAGTGFVGAKSYAYVYGCELFAAKSGSQILPMISALPAPFASVNPGASGVFRLTPVLILPGQTTPGVSNATGLGHTSDALVLMSSGNDGGQVPTLFSSAAADAQLNLPNTLAFSASDLVLLVDQQPVSGGGTAPCVVTQVGSTVSGGASTVLPLGGSWYAPTIDTAFVSAYSSTGAAIDLGNVSTGQSPSFQLVGVGGNNTLYSYDLLKTSDTALQARAESVFELHALYGVDTDADGKVDKWVEADSDSYSVAALTAGTPAAAGLLKNIRSLRVGLILRTALPERDVVNASTSLRLFSDLGGSLTYTRALSGAEQHYRYRTVEETIPLRNNSF
jgi:type IV pilus assembly protein PilW